VSPKAEENTNERENAGIKWRLKQINAEWHVADKQQIKRAQLQVINRQRNELNYGVFSKSKVTQTMPGLGFNKIWKDV